jgi:hydrogenase maturation protein HypF
MGLRGYVLNKGSEVEVVVDKEGEAFIEALRRNLPATASLTEIITKVDNRKFNEFRIVKSKTGSRSSPIPVDSGICDTCLRELFDPTNRRYRYPFTNCTVCGARFSLISDLPYDREKTAMAPFPLCDACHAEYTDPTDRRYHAQTISCPQCGPSYTLYDKKKRKVPGDIIKRAAEFLDDGAIGVIKSWGGMHICCTLHEILQLRTWYGRPQKPFAVMVRDRAAAERYAEITDEEWELLSSNRRPIVLVHKKDEEDISPGISTIGLYLPYTGLHHLLFSEMKKDALIMTSANPSGEPMIIENDDAFSLDADFYLLHNRTILNRIDDSVIKTGKERAFFIRKSRGYVPDPIKIPHKKSVLSVGAEENVCGTISQNGEIYTTQYVGNTRYYATATFLETALRHLMTLRGIDDLDGIGMDIHPLYATRRTAKKFAEEYDAPIREIQHHWAHVAALFVDNARDDGTVLTLDGAGYGSDGTIWGGEILDASFTEFNRVGHLEQIPLIGGDKAVEDPRRIVFAIFKKLGKEPYFTGREAEILSKVMDNAPRTSSFGRVLDALSCYLGICTKKTYNGEPAMKLERYLERGRKRYDFETEVKNGVVRTVPIFDQIKKYVTPVISEREKADLAYSAVITMVEALTEIAMNHAEKKEIGLTGGVSYNIPIIEMVEKRLYRDGYTLLTHTRTPNGDGCIAVGQNVIVGRLLS